MQRLIVVDCVEATTCVGSIVVDCVVSKGRNHAAIRIESRRLFSTTILHCFLCQKTEMIPALDYIHLLQFILAHLDVLQCSQVKSTSVVYLLILI